MYRFCLVALTSVLLLGFAGCTASKIKKGDRAAATGNWKAAYAQYHRAIQKKPDDPTIQAKFEEAKENAYKQSLDLSASALGRNDFARAASEAEYALNIKQNDPAALAASRSAYRGWTEAEIAAANSALSAQNFAGAAGHVQTASGYATRAAEPSVQGRIETTKKSIIDQGRRHAVRLHKEAKRAGELAPAKFDEALATVNALLGLGAPLRPLHEKISLSYQRWKDAEFDRLARMATAATRKHDWANAMPLWGAANQMRPGAVNPDIEYVRAMMAAESAMAARDYLAASDAYRKATSTGRDVDRFAENQLYFVEPRPYRFKLLSVLVRPVRPDGRPWTGRANRTLGTIRMPTNQRLYSGDSYREGGRLGRKWGGSIRRVPPVNHPSLIVEVTLPDGRKFRTEPKRGVYASFDASFTLISNHYDDRTVTFRVFHKDKRGEVDAGAVLIPLGAVLNGEGAAATQSLLGLEMYAEPAGRDSDGMVRGMKPVFGPTNEAQQASPATPGTLGFQLVTASVVVRQPDFTPLQEQNDGPPDLRLEIEQKGLVVYRSPEARDTFRGNWSPEAVYLFVNPEEKLTLRLWDIDQDKPDLIYSTAMTGAQVERNSATFKTTNGSTVTVEFSPRPAMPLGR